MACGGAGPGFSFLLTDDRRSVVALEPWFHLLCVNSGEGGHLDACCVAVVTVST